MAEQSCQDFELCIADDCSPDHRQEELRTLLRELKMRFVFRQQQLNVRYDANLRTAIALASGRFCLLMGNDDQLSHPHVLRDLRQVLECYPTAGVVIPNYAEYSGERVYRRSSSTALRRSGPELAVRVFRNFSFVSGLILRRDRAQSHATTQWDGSEMYQMYLGCRIIAEGFDLVEVAGIAVQKSILLEGASVDSYAKRPRVKAWPLRERRLPLGQMGSLVFDAVRPFAPDGSALGLRIFSQILLFTYPFWIVEYRRVQSWHYAVGICLGMRPRNILHQTNLRTVDRLSIRIMYVMMSLAGLAVPISLFQTCQSKLHAFAKYNFRRH
ncbi:MAG: glycosyltransferase family 2 protein [Acidobacteriota bacterium]|nr:glycosyltransferase family 2 protein [Acidobacteriota bacterium]